MFDDIDPVSEDPDAVAAEMAFHGDIATRLASRLDIPVQFVPRIYADEISPHAAAAYRVLNGSLPADMAVFHCGSHIVAGADPLSDEHRPDRPSGSGSSSGTISSAMILPAPALSGAARRPQRIDELMLNGTGMIETDLLLLDVMAAGDDQQAWRAALAKTVFRTISITSSPGLARR